MWMACSLTAHMSFEAPAPDHAGAPRPDTGSANAALPDLFFAGAAAVGTPLDLSFNALVQSLSERGYDVESTKLSRLTELFRLPTEMPGPDAGEYERTSALMSRGDELRAKADADDVLVRLGISVISGNRKSQEGRGFCGVFRQLKRPEEAYLLREVYGDGFHLVGIYAPRAARAKRLQYEEGMTEQQALDLIQRDEFESDEAHGQRVRDTFHLADVFIRVTGVAEDLVEVRKQLSRFVDLLFGAGIHTPTKDEYGMFLAWAAGLRSAQLGRQVGAAILRDTGDVISVGTNEVPKGGGGQYWEGEVGGDGRDHAYPRRDSTDAMKQEMLAEILDVLEPQWKDVGEQEQLSYLRDRQNQLRHTRLMNLTEFTRAVHAEMEAILSAARVGVSVEGGTLYTTTFPCHNCTKHIVDAGIARVVFIEPYAKSMARELHNDAIKIEGEPDEITTFSHRVPFVPFVGVAPRRYADLFSMVAPDGRLIRRKNAQGEPILEATGLRLKLRRDSYLERERVIAETMMKLQKQEKSDD